VTDETFAALERRLAPVLAEGGRGYVDRHDVLDLLAECRALRADLGRLRLPPDASGLMTAADLETLRAWAAGWEPRPLPELTAMLAHVDAANALVRELYGVVSDLHAEDPGRQALLERGRAEGREMVLGVLRKFFGTPDPAEYPALAAAFEVAHALGPCRPPLPPQEAEREAGRLRGALLACVRAVGQVTRAEPAGVMGPLVAAYESARKALGEEPCR
jgi:hypothetical protein